MQPGTLGLLSMRSTPQLLGIDYLADQRGIKGLPSIRKNPALGHVASVASMSGRSAFWALGHFSMGGTSGYGEGQ